MNRTTQNALKGLLLMAAGVSLSATPILTLTSQSFSIDGGGQFTGTLSNNPSQQLQAYCVDFNNFASVGNAYDVNVSTMGDLSKTRYGTTAQSAFTYQQAPNGANIGDSSARYALAGWLISQYNLTPGAGNSAKNVGVQNAIWNILDTTGAQHTNGDWSTWMNNAAANVGAARGQAGAIKIFTSTSVASATGATRYAIGAQEMISLGAVVNNSVPEPQSAVLIGFGGLLIGLGTIRRRKKASTVS